MPPGRRRTKSAADRKRADTRRRVQVEPTQKLQATHRGILDELVRPAGRAPLTVWMLAWRCKRCGYTWPVRRFKHNHGPQAGEVFSPKPGGKTPTVAPKKCPGCDTKDWWKDYREPLDGPRRRGRGRKPYMSILANQEPEPETQGS